MDNNQPGFLPTFELGGIVTEFLLEYRFPGKEKTLAYYHDHVERALVQYLHARGIRELLGVTPAVLKEWLLEESGRVSMTTVGGRYDAAHRFFGWCEDQEYVRVSPMRKVKRPQIPELSPRAYDDDEMQRLLLHATKAAGWLGQRDKAIVTLLAGTGARAAEVLSLTPQSIDWQRHRIQLYGKGQKFRHVPMGRKVASSLREYIRVRPQVAPLNLFISQRRTVFNYGAMSMMLENLGHYSGVPDVRAHRFRHTFACRFYRETKDIMALKAILGHSKVTVTERYLKSLGVDYGFTEYDMDTVF